MTGVRTTLALLVAGFLGAPVAADVDVVTWYDLGGDVLVRPTDPGLMGLPNPSSTLPNLLSLTVGPWQTPTAATNPYSGSYTTHESGQLLRIDLELKGVVNPPGSVSFANYNPYEFGLSPLYGYFELDVDGDRDTGGELGPGAKNRYLANVGRFGRIPLGPIGQRSVKLGWQTDADFFSPPQFERSGADFVLAFCGCYPTTIVSESGNNNHIFEAGETWIVRGGFFQRAGGYQGACSSVGGAAGLQIGQYVPYVNLRWSHSTATDRTTITLIFPATMIGAGQLAGEAPQPVNLSASDQVSLVEALTDLITGSASVQTGTPLFELCSRWVGRNPSDARYRDPGRWSATALVGTAYPQPVNGAVFIWTDCGFNDIYRDLDGNGSADPQDKQVVINALDGLDGSAWDAGGSGREDGQVLLINPGVNFAVADVDGDGAINLLDLRCLCPGDFNRDGVINLLDYMTFFDAYSVGHTSADMNANGLFDAGDFMAFLNAVAAGC